MWWFHFPLLRSVTQALKVFKPSHSWVSSSCAASRSCVSECSASRLNGRPARLGRPRCGRAARPRRRLLGSAMRLQQRPAAADAGPPPPPAPVHCCLSLPAGRRLRHPGQRRASMWSVPPPEVEVVWRGAAVDGGRNYSSLGVGLHDARRALCSCAEQPLLARRSAFKLRACITCRCVYYVCRWSTEVL